MKTKLIAAVALLSTSFTPISVMTTAAQATNPTITDAQAYCDATYVATQADPSVWRATVVNFTSTDGATTQVDGSARDINYRADLGSTFGYAGFTGAANPLSRTGGSPNMWGQATFSQKVYDNTLFDTEADFTHTVTYSWTCHVEEYVTTTTHVGGGNGGDNGGGSGNNGNNNGQNQQDGGNGNGNNGCGNGNGGPNGTNEHANCGGGHDVTTSEWTNAMDYSDGTAAGDDVDEGYSTIATGVQQAGHVAGVNYTVYGSYSPAGIRALACISPGKKGGAWTAKNSYTGGLCSTATFNAAPTLAGTTFDSPPTNSLPAL
ncbi:MAG: hypothetical protein ABIO80_03020 [Sphingomicrobium sp.]